MSLTSSTIGEALLHGEMLLKSTNTLHPRKHAELLLGKATELNRVNLYINASNKIIESESTVYSEMLERRSAGEPIQYILGTTPFYGRDFRVAKGVFIPRFDSEVLIEKVLAAYKKRLKPVDQIEILDLCCGSGVLGLTAALEIPESKVTLVDNSSIALDFTAQNADCFGISNRVELVERNAKSEFPKSWHHKFDYVIANPPYIPTADTDGLDTDVQHEPYGALTDGGNGLSFYQAWGSNLNTILKPNGFFFCEIDSYISKYIRSIMDKHFRDIAISRDLSGNLRVCEVTVK